MKPLLHGGEKSNSDHQPQPTSIHYHPQTYAQAASPPTTRERLWSDYRRSTTWQRSVDADLSHWKAFLAERGNDYFEPENFNSDRQPQPTSTHYHPQTYAQAASPSSTRERLWSDYRRSTTWQRSVDADLANWKAFLAERGYEYFKPGETRSNSNSFTRFAYVDRNVRALNPPTLNHIEIPAHNARRDPFSKTSECSTSNSHNCGWTFVQSKKSKNFHQRVPQNASMASRFSKGSPLDVQRSDSQRPYNVDSNLIKNSPCA
jgi:hypothetical protein